MITITKFEQKNFYNGIIIFIVEGEIGKDLTYLDLLCAKISVECSCILNYEELQIKKNSYFKRGIHFKKGEFRISRNIVWVEDK